VNYSPLKKISRRWGCRHRLKYAAYALGCIVAAFVAMDLLSPTSIPSLTEKQHFFRSSIMAKWHSGDLIILIRHEERCDRSNGPCLGPADGITISGAASAALLGEKLRALGVENSDVWNSPSTRTSQTAFYIFGKNHSLSEPRGICGSAMNEKLIAAKAQHRNLLLVTHSQCISDLAKNLNYPHIPRAAYGSALIVELTKAGKLKLLGVVDKKDWLQLLEQ